jgi:hypothetical protein
LQREADPFSSTETNGYVPMPIKVPRYAFEVSIYSYLAIAGLKSLLTFHTQDMVHIEVDNLQLVVPVRRSPGSRFLGI